MSERVMQVPGVLPRLEAIPSKETSIYFQCNPPDLGLL